MLPDSDALEALHERIRAVLRQLNACGSSRVTELTTLSELGAIAKEWLRTSASLRAVPNVNTANIDEIDSLMNSVLTKTTGRSRASNYYSSLDQVNKRFIPEVLVPLIKAEGSPDQVSARQLHTLLAPHLLPEEVHYVDEASRCLTLQCFRAAIIMLWSAAIARLHRAIETLGFAAFNAASAAASSRGGGPFNRLTKSLSITSLPELQRTRDFDIIVIGMELWKYDLQTFQELDRLLGTRNDSAHPGTLQPTALDVQQFATKLQAYIFQPIRP